MSPKRRQTDTPLPLEGLLGREPKLRHRMAQQLLSFGLVLANSLMLGYAVLLARTPLGWWLLWVGVALAVQLSISLAVRLGWTARLADPSLASTQIGLMLLLGAAAYPLSGQLRGLVVPMMMLTLAFGLFAPSGQAMLRLNALGLALILAAMGFDFWVWPGRAQPAETMGHALFAMVCFPGLGLLLLRMARLRERQREQRQALNEALTRINRLATRDDLTGLYNRRHGKHVLQQALQRQKRKPTGLLAVLLDLDHFKKINDTKGHAAGDAVLRCFAKALHQSLRKGDTAVRWGGEEFVVLLEPTASEGLLAWVARLKLAIERQPLVTERPELRFTFSGGAAFWRPGESLEHWLERADAALYRAKAEGRDRIVEAS